MGVTIIHCTMKSLQALIIFLPLILSHKIVKRQEGEGGGFQGPASREVEPGVYSFSLNGAWISMFIITSEGVMVIDPMNVAHSEAMLAEIRELTSLPIRYLFYSHNHWDHTKGGQVWKNEGATIISHVDAYDWIEENPSEDLVLPDEQWSGDMFQVTLGQTTLELHSTGPSHGQGMTMFVLPREKVGFIADLATPNQAIFFFMPDFNIPGLIKSLESYLQYDVDKIVFSHSSNDDILAPGTKEVHRFIIQYLKDIQAAVRAELAAGTNPFLIAPKIDLPQYSQLKFYDAWFTQNVQAVVVSEVLGPLSWHRTNEKLITSPRLGDVSNSVSDPEPSQPALPAKNPWTGKPWKSSTNPWKTSSSSSSSSPWGSSSSWTSNQNAWAQNGWKRYKGYNNLYWRHMSGK